MVASVPNAGSAAQDDRAVMGSWSAPATDSLGSQQPLTSQQPQDPVPADVHAVLATQPGPELAVALASERRVGQHPPDQPNQPLVADRWHRSGSAWLATSPPAGGDAGAGRTQHPAHHRHAKVVLHG
jgi:hypothetical protein